MICLLMKHKNFFMLSLLLLIPIIGSIFLLFVTDGPSGEKSKKIALVTSLINLILSIYLFLKIFIYSRDY